MEIFIEKKVRGQREHLKEEQLFNQVIAKEDNSCYSMCLIYYTILTRPLNYLLCIGYPLLVYMHFSEFLDAWNDNIFLSFICQYSKFLFDRVF